MQTATAIADSRSPPPAGARREHDGFSLIELMVTVAIVGVLAGIAYPTYISFTHKSNRADATTTMINDAQILQRCYSQTYDFTQCTNPPSATGLAAAATSPNGYYDIQITTTDSTHFQIKATAAKAPQMSDTDCKSFTLDSSGAQGSTGSATSQTCWGSN